MLQNWSFAEKPKLYKKKNIGSGMKNILLLMSLHLRKKKLITDFKHTFNVIIITVNGGELF